ncbi:hypothetical protein B0H65DRAFT_437786 [Neurospora tetraspora]|uniref:Uncharacterized protein n=1 Tax=Neurospora tetraspora TaxID=94610 RepID=A0AAE0MVX4_9PEZI|nr:hypothetical protein B0H65DRAFT_437786 [Neurospora tetraspora]
MPGASLSEDGTRNCRDGHHLWELECSGDCVYSSLLKTQFGHAKGQSQKNDFESRTRPERRSFREAPDFIAFNISQSCHIAANHKLECGFPSSSSSSEQILDYLSLSLSQSPHHLHRIINCPTKGFGRLGKRGQVGTLRAPANPQWYTRAVDNLEPRCLTIRVSIVDSRNRFLTPSRNLRLLRRTRTREPTPVRYLRGHNTKAGRTCATKAPAVLK